MAWADWRRYYFPVMVHKHNGHCRIWGGKPFRKREKATARALQINASERTNWRCIGIAAIKAKKHNAELQRDMANGCRVYF